MSEKPCLAKLEFNQTAETLGHGSSVDTGFIDMAEADKYQLSWMASITGLTLETQSKSRLDDPALSNNFTYNASTLFLGSFPVRQRYMRFILKNETGNNALFVNLEVKTTYGSSDKATVFPLEAKPKAYSPAVLTQSVITGKDDNGNYNNVKVSPDGQLIVEISGGSIQCLLEGMIEELKIMNLQLSIITGDEIKSGDIK